MTGHGASLLSLAAAAHKLRLVQTHLLLAVLEPLDEAVLVHLGNRATALARVIERFVLLCAAPTDPTCVFFQAHRQTFRCGSLAVLWGRRPRDRQWDGFVSKLHLFHYGLPMMHGSRVRSRSGDSEVKEKMLL